MPILMIFMIIIGCERELPEKYQAQDWLKGKIFTQIQDQENLNTFITCLERTGYDTVLDVSGSYSVFAPTDSAFDVFFQNNPLYTTLSDIPDKELEDIVESQIISDAWSIQQFKSLDFFGWIDPDNELQEPRAYKHKTLYHPENSSFPAIKYGNKYKITELDESTTSVIAYSESNKYCPIFFDAFFDVYDLNYSDYEFYFNRTFESENLYFSGAKFNVEIPAENGFVYKTDKVILPLPTGAEVLEEGTDEYSYDKFLALTKLFSEFTTNLEATLAQPGAEEGLDVETLYNLDYPELIFNIHSELTGNTNNPAFTYRDHHGLMAPTDKTFDAFIDEYITPGWGSFEAMPIEIRKIIVNAYMSKNAIYPTTIKKGFINGNLDSINLSMDNIVQRTFASNCTFIGLNEPIIPRAFISISRPLYLTKQFTTMLYAVEKTKVLSTLKKPNTNYTFYLPSDMGIGMIGDSSMIRVVDNADFNTYHFEEFARGDQSWMKISTYDLRKKILNQIASSLPDGTANKEFIRNLGGNYIVVDHANGFVRGTAPTTYGVGGKLIDLQPVKYTKETDNGEVYVVSSFFNFTAGVNFYSLFISKYLRFYQLLAKAGLYDPIYNRFPELIDGEYYTVFIPSDEALTDYGVDILSKAKLKELLQYHFVRGHIIFTDGKKDDGFYPTTRIDESSTTYNTKYSTLNINTGPDVIQILDNDGNTYVEIEEEEGHTNQVISYDPNSSSESKWDFITTGVVHEIDKVLVRDSLQAK